LTMTASTSNSFPSILSQHTQHLVHFHSSRLAGGMLTGPPAKQANRPGYCYHPSRTASSDPAPPGQQESTLDLSRIRQANTGTMLPMMDLNQ
jgi:hypothetical protein